MKLVRNMDEEVVSEEHLTQQLSFTQNIKCIVEAFQNLFVHVFGSMQSTILLDTYYGSVQ